MRQQDLLMRIAGSLKTLDRSTGSTIRYKNTVCRSAGSIAQEYNSHVSRIDSMRVKQSGQQDLCNGPVVKVSRIYCVRVQQAGPQDPLIQSTGSNNISIRPLSRVSRTHSIKVHMASPLSPKTLVCQLEPLGRSAIYQGHPGMHSAVQRLS